MVETKVGFKQHGIKGEELCIISFGLKALKFCFLDDFGRPIIDATLIKRFDSRKSAMFFGYFYLE